MLADLAFVLNRTSAGPIEKGASGHCPRLAGGPEFVPVMVGAGFRQSTEVAHALGCPKLAGPFEPALPLPTGRFYRAAANRPAAPVQAPVVHPPRVRGKIVLLALDHFTRWSSRQFQSGQFGQHLFFFAVAQLVAAGFHPSGDGGFVVLVQRAPHFPQVLAGVVKIQHLGRAGPPVLRHVPDPRRAIARHQRGAGAAQPAALGLPVQARAKLHGVALPADHDLLRQHAAAAGSHAGLLVPVEDARLPFVPFHAGFGRFLFPPAGAALTHLPAIEHQHGKPRGRALGLAFWRRGF